MDYCLIIYAGKRSRRFKLCWSNLSATPRRFGRRRVKKVQKVTVYCQCRLPWDRHDTSLGSLAQCRACKEWFHQSCATIPQDAFIDRHYVMCSAVVNVLFTCKINYYNIFICYSIIILCNSYQQRVKKLWQ